MQVEEFYRTKKHRYETFCTILDSVSHVDEFYRRLEGMWQLPDPCVGDSPVELVTPGVLNETVADRFYRLAQEWTAQTGNVSSLSTLVKHEKYREIVKLGWDIVPLLLRDLQQNHRFWFPALREITQIQPYDRHDAGNTKRMTQAWIEWGKRKQLI